MATNKKLYGLFPGGQGEYSNDKCIGGTATQSSTLTPPTRSANYAFDDDSATFAQTAYQVACPSWIKYEFTTALAITKVTIQNYGVGQASNAFSIAGSNDDIEYTTLYTGNMANNGDVQTFTFTNPTAYKYIKITITSSYWADYCHTFREIEMMISFPGEEAEWLPIKVDSEGKVVLSP